MNVNGITNTGTPHIPPGLERGPVPAEQVKIPAPPAAAVETARTEQPIPQVGIQAQATPQMDVEKMIPQPGRVSYEERLSQVISKDEIIQLLSLKLPGSPDRGGHSTGTLIDVKS